MQPFIRGQSVSSPAGHSMQEPTTCMCDSCGSRLLLYYPRQTSLSFRMHHAPPSPRLITIKDSTSISKIQSFLSKFCSKSEKDSIKGVGYLFEIPVLSYWRNLLLILIEVFVNYSQSVTTSPSHTLEHKLWNMFDHMYSRISCWIQMVHVWCWNWCNTSNMLHCQIRSCGHWRHCQDNNPPMSLFLTWKWAEIIENRFWSEFSQCQ